MRTSAILAVALLSSIPANAQQWQDQVSSVFAQDGMRVELIAPTVQGSVEKYPGVRTSTPGYMRVDGWFVGPTDVLLGPVTRDGTDVTLPALSLPIRKTEASFHNGRIEGLRLSEGGILSQGFDKLAFGPVSITKEDGVFASIDELVVQPDGKGCFELTATGMAISAKKTLPAIAAAGKDFYQGTGHAGFVCDGADWTLTTLTLEAAGLGAFQWHGEIKIPAQEMLDLVVQRRNEMNELFVGDLDIIKILVSDAMTYLDLANMVKVPTFSFSFEDDGAFTAIKGAIDGAAWLGMRDAAIDQLTSAFPADLQSAVSTALKEMLGGKTKLEVSMNRPTATLGDIALGAVPASSWTITTAE